ncbi:MAG: carboxypeptidase-like regulatory domain-containing protein [Sphingobacteriaceae bacterium]|nr:carboxypeptidase-like regulatory domain-containing protein [Sphingobacteriaceae bacterium]
MKLVLRILTLFILISSNALFGQMPGGGNQKDMLKMMKDIKGRVYGKVIDAKTKKPVEFASVVLLWYNKDSAIAGGFTEDNGDFNLEGLPAMGGFRLRVTQVGYKTYEQKIYIQAPQKLEQDLGNLAMEIDPKLLNEVEVVAEKATFQMSVDRKVYNVEKGPFGKRWNRFGCIKECANHYS